MLYKHVLSRILRAILAKLLFLLGLVFGCFAHNDGVPSSNLGVATNKIKARSELTLRAFFYGCEYPVRLP